jgi:hypothetical protein
MRIQYNINLVLLEAASLEQADQNPHAYNLELREKLRNDGSKTRQDFF